MKWLFIISCIVTFFTPVKGQSLKPDSLTAAPIDFVSDTQQPLGVEKIYLKPTQNVRATEMIFAAVLRDKPSAVFMLGDIVSLGYRNKKWRSADRFLDSAKQQHIGVYAVLGNHDVMVKDKRGERNFSKRFPEHRRTGYLKIIDSIAMVLLNSNFSKLSVREIDQQQRWYLSIIDSLDHDAGIRGIIVGCHHPVFTNSNMVKPSAGVRGQFLPAFLRAKKCVLFITGHAHAFEHFVYQQKNFLVIGGGGGLHQPLTLKANMPADKAIAYKPLFHYLQLRRYGNFLQLVSQSIQPDFSGFDAGYSFSINMQ